MSKTTSLSKSALLTVSMTTMKNVGKCTDCVYRQDGLHNQVKFLNSLT